MIFEVKKKDEQSLARYGVIKTRRGDIETPVFMPVGTVGAVKALQHRALASLARLMPQEVYNDG